QLEAKREGVLSGSRRKFVDKTLDDETAAGMFDRAPPRPWRAGVRQGVLDANIRRLVRDGGARAEFTLAVVFFAFCIPLGRDRGRSLEMFPRGEISVRVHDSLAFVIGRGTIKIVVHVVFASPQDHDGLAGFFRDL